MARYLVSKASGPKGLGGSTPSPSAPFRRGRAGKTRGCYPRGAGSIPAAGAHALVVEEEMTLGSQPGSCGFEPRRGYATGRREDGHPTGFGRRRPLVRLQPTRLAR
jgi:hypothetical protein